MPTVRVTAKAPLVVPTHPRVIIHAENKQRLEIPLAAPLSHSGLAAKYETHDRVGQPDTIHKTGNPLHVMNVTLKWVARTKGYIDPQKSIEPDLQVLRGFARSGLRLWFIGWGASAGGWFRITDFSINVTSMKAGTNDATSADVTLTLTKPTDQLPLGPLTGGAQSSAKAATRPSTLTTQSGQSLYAAAFAATGDGENWKAIADANGVLPHKIAPGMTLRVPAR